MLYSLVLSCQHRPQFPSKKHPPFHLQAVLCLDLSQLAIEGLNKMRAIVRDNNTTYHGYIENLKIPSLDSPKETME